jgi:hypothetical protein
MFRMLITSELRCFGMGNIPAVMNRAITDLTGVVNIHDRQNHAVKNGHLYVGKRSSVARFLQLNGDY